MRNVVVVGKRFVPTAQVALIEAFDPEANPKFQPTQDYRSRVVLVNRDSVLALDPIEAIATEHGFRMIAEDRVATNPALFFAVERFVAAEGFEPTKPYLSRLRWRDPDGNDQSKLLLSSPETVLAAITGEGPVNAGEDPKPRRSKRARTARRSRPSPRAEP